MRSDCLAPLTTFVLEYSVLPLLVLDGDGSVVQTNAAARAAGVDFTALFAAHGSEMAAFVGELHQHARAQIELDGEDGACWLLDGVAIDGWTVVRAREVGAERDLHQELRALRSIGALALVASATLHDLADALSPLLILSSRLAHELEKGNATSMMASDIHSSATLAANLVRELLPLARPRPRSIECIDANGALHESRRFIERVVGAGVKVRLEPAASAATVVVDRARLEHSLLGLAAIARDEMTYGGDVTFRIRVSEEPSNTFVVIEAVLEPRPAPSGTSTPPPAHVGVDLSALQSFARESGGRVLADGHPLRSIGLHLPHFGVATRKGDDDGSGGVVLVADRDERVRRTLHAAFGMRGYSVTHAHNEAAALDEARRHPPSVAIVDTHIPTRDPRTFVARLRAIVPQMRIIFLADALAASATHRDRVPLLAQPSDDAITSALREALQIAPA